MQKTFKAVVVSLKQKDTAVVEITRKKSHPLYKKLLTVSERLQVDTNGANVEVGQAVKIIGTRPLSKTKHFKILEVKK